MEVTNVSGPFELSDFPDWAQAVILDTPEGDWVKLTGTLRAKYHYNSTLAVYMACDMHGFIPGPLLLV